MVLSVRSFYYTRDYIHFYMHYIHYIHSVDSQSQIQQSKFAGGSPPCHLMTSPVHRSLLRACGCLVSVVDLSLQFFSSFIDLPGHISTF